MRKTTHIAPLPYPFRLVFSLAVFLAVFLALAGCREPAAPGTPAAVENELVSREPALVVPDDRFKEHGRKDRWRFQNRASLVCWIRDEGAEPLVIRLTPNRATAQHHFRFEWDDRELPPARVRRAEEGAFRLEIDPARLTPGRHELKLKRDYKQDDPAHRKRLQNVFLEVFYRYGPKKEVLAPDRLDRYRLLAQFLQYGVIGKAPERRGGVLFAGPARHRLELADRGAAGREAVSLHFEPQNFSGQRAVFRAAGRTLALKPGQRGRLSVDLDAAAREVELKVEGETRGYFLWGMPRVERRRAFLELAPVVLITLDTTRRDALGVYNGRAGVTPELDRLAREATVFEQAYSTAPWTLPSHASMFTGLYPSKHGAGVSRKQLGDVPTLAGLLRRRGYFAAGFSSGELSSSRFGLAQGFHYYRDPDKFETAGSDLAGYLDEALHAYAHLPLFLFVNYFDPHALYQAPARWEEKLGVPALRDKLRGQPAWSDLVDGKMSGWRRIVEGGAEATPEGLEFLRAAYLAEVAHTDHLLGRLFERLRRLGLYDRALIVVTADHGELLGERGFFSHGARLDPELVEIPLIVKWPGQKEGRRSRRLVSLVDLFPTVLQVAGVEPPPSDGLPLPRGSDDGYPAHSFLFLEEHESIVHPLPKAMKLDRHLFGVQRPTFRQLVWGSEQSCARRDAGGWRDEPCGTGVESVLEAIRAQLGLVDAEDEDPAVLDDVQESLEALGYM